MSTSTLDKFTKAYITAALWSSTDNAEDPLEDYSITDLAPETFDHIKMECEKFQSDNADLLSEAYDLYTHSSEWTHQEQAGHDFWLTRNGHGAGFWDRGLGEIGTKLTAASKACGECDIYVGDDNQIYCQ